MVAPEPSSSPGFGGALDGIINGLQKHPPLLYGLGGGILLIGLVGAVGGIAADQLWLLIAALVLLILAGLGAWLYVSRAGTSKHLRLRGNAEAQDNGKILTAEGPLPEGLDISIKGKTIKASGHGQIGTYSSGMSKAPPDPES